MNVLIFENWICGWVETIEINGLMDGLTMRLTEKKKSFWMEKFNTLAVLLMVSMNFHLKFGKLYESFERKLNKSLTAKYSNSKNLLIVEGFS
jgi:hypothetical protein